MLPPRKAALIVHVETVSSPRLSCQPRTLPASTKDYLCSLVMCLHRQWDKGNRQLLPDAVKSAVWVHLNRIKPSLGGFTEVLRGHKVSVSMRVFLL